MTLEIKEVKSKEQWNTFIYLPEKIHQNHSNWLHPLYMDEKKFFDKKHNSSFAHNATILLLAYREGKAVGRIMGIVPHQYNKSNQTRCVRFSYMECYKDKEVFDALLKAVEKWSKKYQCNEIIGPMGFSDKEPQGFVTKGFKEPTMLVTNCTYSYMKDYIEENDFSSFVTLYEYEVPIDAQVTSRYEKYVERVTRNQKVRALNFNSTKEVRPYVASVFDLINDAYRNIYGFTQVTDKERDEFTNRFLPLLNAKLIKMVVDDSDKVLAFVVAMADLSKGIRKAKGRLFPLGWYHILKASKKSKRLVLLLGGVSPKMQNKGLDAILATNLFKSALKLGFTTMDSHLIMKSNTKMRAEIERLQGHRLYKEYTIYRKEIK